MENTSPFLHVVVEPSEKLPGMSETLQGLVEGQRGPAASNPEQTEKGLDREDNEVGVREWWMKKDSKILAYRLSSLTIGNPLPGLTISRLSGCSPGTTSNPLYSPKRHSALPVLSLVRSSPRISIPMP